MTKPKVPCRKCGELTEAACRLCCDCNPQYHECPMCGMQTRAQSDGPRGRCIKCQEKQGRTPKSVKPKLRMESGVVKTNRRGGPCRDCGTWVAALDDDGVLLPQTGELLCVACYRVWNRETACA